MSEFALPTEEEIRSVPNFFKEREGPFNQTIWEFAQYFPATVEGENTPKTTINYEVGNYQGIVEFPNDGRLNPEYTTVVIKDKDGKILYDFLTEFPPGKKLKKSNWDSTIAGKEGMFWRGPIRLFNVFVYFHERGHMELEEEMSDSDYNDIMSNVSSSYKPQVTGIALQEKIASNELQAWARGMRLLQDSPLRETVFTSYSNEQLRLVALSAYKSYLKTPTRAPI